MRQKLLRDGASKLEYEIRNIVKKAKEVEKLGRKVYWENIGDPIQKHAKVPEWMKEIVANLAKDDLTYGYCDSKGVLETRQFLADLNNQYGGARITSSDVLFFNGLGDAIAKLYQFLPASSRIIGPSPAYSTHSSSEAAHANSEPLTYKLDPENFWYPDLDDLYNKVKYNPNVVGILIINPDNPTGMVYPKTYLQRMVEIAREFDLFIISDEIYGNITFNGSETLRLTEVIGDVPGIALKGISKELPWPGARCGWMEFYNRSTDQEFNEFCHTLEDAKMVEVCSTTLPQKAIPLIMQDPRYPLYLKEKNEAIEKRSESIAAILEDVEEITFVKTKGAFYNTVVFRKDVLKMQSIPQIDNPDAKHLFESWTSENLAPDKRFVYYLLAVKGVCVVPLSSFHSELYGFRVTLLEEDIDLLKETFGRIKEAVKEFCHLPVADINT